MGVVGQFTHALQMQRGHLVPWTPVCLAIGIGLYFGLRFEPGLPIYCGVLVGAALCAAAGHRLSEAWAPVAWAIVLVAMGFCVAGLRANSLAAPVLDWRYYGPVEGRIVAIDRSASDAVRLTLGDVRLTRMRVDNMPARVRLSLHGAASETVPVPGQWIMTTAHLSPPQGPAEPGGFDFRRHAWFKQLGAVGYTRVPVLLAAPPANHAWSERLFALRMAVSRHIQGQLDGDTGGFAAAVTTGDRSGVSQDALSNLRESNLAHLLAISGLHMGLLTGFVFAAIRTVLALVPYVALRWPTKKLAAIGAMAAAACYLALSGGNVATERAFIMVAVALVAVLFDRRALSLRAVAFAALIVLSLRPEALLSPGFQMSFAATTALVAVFTALRDHPWSHVPGWLQPVLGIVISSAVAGLATAPIAAAHFNMFSQYGLLANITSVPLMGLVVIPMAVLALALAPLGLEGWALAVMALGLDWILFVAREVSGLAAAVRPIATPSVSVLPVLALSILWGILWQGRARAMACIGLVTAMALWGASHRPPILVADTGVLVGVMTEEGRALSRARGAGFVADIWLENDGDRVSQETAAARWTGPLDRLSHMPMDEEGGLLIHASGKKAAARISDCKAGDVIVSSAPLALTGPCQIFDPGTLKQTGSVAIYPDRIETAAAHGGQRLWSGQ